MTVGELLAADLPARDDESESDLISLVDIVITGIEAVPWVHFIVDDYNPDASGEGPDNAWAILNPLEAAQPPEGIQGTIEPRFEAVYLTTDTVRKAVAAYADARIDGGMALEAVRNLMDGSYTDAVVADSVLQFAIYGEEVFS
jgi:hypothetical protein